MSLCRKTRLPDGRSMLEATGDADARDDEEGFLPAFLSRLSQPQLHRIFAYWSSRRRAEDFPDRRDLDPLDFPYAIGNVTLIEVEPPPLCFRFRLVARDMTDRLGHLMAGKPLDSYPEPQTREFLRAVYATVVSERRPWGGRSVCTFDQRVWRDETIVMPLAADGRSIDMLMSVRYTLEFQRDRTRLADPRL